jgi:hypothetical protein
MMRQVRPSAKAPGAGVASTPRNHPPIAGLQMLLSKAEIGYQAGDQSRASSAMTNTSSLLLLPFLLAFLVFVFRFYSRERAASVANTSFLLAIATILIAGGYLFLGVTEHLPPYSTLGFSAIGLILLTVSIVRIFML